MRILRRTPGGARWRASELELPRMDPAASLLQQRWCVVAGGLALILSRLGETERASRFSYTDQLYAGIREALQRARPVAAGAELIGEVMHEVAETADGLTRQCLKSCFLASMRQFDAGAGCERPTSALVSQPQPSTHAQVLAAR